MISIVTDSASMIPPRVRDRLGVEVVPLTVTVDGVDYRDGVDLDPDDFYDRLAAGAAVTTAAPPPGAFLAAYQRAEHAGATAVLSIHTGGAYSATAAAANAAGKLTELPVTVVDTGMASFPVALCTWAAANALAAGAPIDDAAAAARETAAQTESVFVVGLPARAHGGGRFQALGESLAPASILSLDRDGLREIDRVDDLDAAMDTIAAHVEAVAAQQTICAGIGDARRPHLSDTLAQRLTAADGVAELVRYDVGPSVGAHIGEGSVGVVYTPW